MSEEEVAMECLSLLRDLCCIAALRSHEKDQRQHEHQTTDARIILCLQSCLCCPPLRA